VSEDFNLHQECCENFKTILKRTQQNAVKNWKRKPWTAHSYLWFQKNY